MRKYYNFTVNKIVTIKNLITLEYLNISPKFNYPIECHDFYEFAYVDNGSIICNCSKVETVLNQNEFFLIKPNEPHNYKSNKNKSASVFIVCFSCKSDFLQLITDKTTVDDYSKLILSKILSEAHNAFKFPFNKKLLICENPIFGAQQLINNAIEELLINLIRQKINLSKEISIVSNKEELHNNVVRDIILLLKQNIFGKISLDEISARTFYSKTYINKLFKKSIGSTIIDYYLDLKIEESKKMLLSGIRVTKISEKLNFDSPNYFTKVFRKKVGCSPTNYKKNQ